MSFNTILASSVALTILVIVFVLDLVSNWKVFVKMGEPGWKCLIPFYSLYVECKHVWSTAGFAILMLLSVVMGILYCFQSTTSFVIAIIILAIGFAGFVLRILFYHYKSRAFGKSVGTTLLLLFFPFIANLVLGLGSCEYEGNKAIK